MLNYIMYITKVNFTHLFLLSKTGLAEDSVSRAARLAFLSRSGCALLALSLALAGQAVLTGSSSSGVLIIPCIKKTV